MEAPASLPLYSKPVTQEIRGQEEKFGNKQSFLLLGTLVSAKGQGPEEAEVPPSPFWVLRGLDPPRPNPHLVLGVADVWGLGTVSTLEK